MAADINPEEQVPEEELENTISEMGELDASVESAAEHESEKPLDLSLIHIFNILGWFTWGSTPYLGYISASDRDSAL